MRWTRDGWVWTTIGLLLVGCNSRATRVRPVNIDASSASKSALQSYDKDGSGTIAGEELDAVPGIKMNLGRYDTDGEPGVSQQEIAARLRDWAANKLALMGATYIITLDGKPLDGATVTLVPEPYMGPNVHTASGVTGPSGLTRLSHDDEHLPKTANGRTIPGVTAGTFKVEITHPGIEIPAKYNSATELGLEVAYDINPGDLPNRLALSTK